MTDKKLSYWNPMRSPSSAKILINVILVAIAIIGGGILLIMCSLSTR